MHRLRSRHSVVRFKAASWALVIKWSLLSTSLGILAYSLPSESKNLSYLSFCLVAGALFVAGLQWIIAVQARCPLCLTPPIAHSKCSKHRSAKSLFGSYCLPVACSVIFRSRFRCPYCGEWTEVRPRRDA